MEKVELVLHDQGLSQGGDYNFTEHIKTCHYWYMIIVPLDKQGRGTEYVCMQICSVLSYSLIKCV
jgi:hypothetical protein